MSLSYAPLLLRGVSFKLKKMKLLPILKILTDKVHCIKNLHSSGDLIDADSNGILEVLASICRHLTESNDLFMSFTEMERKKENWKKFPKKRKARAMLTTISNKIQLNHPSSKNV